MATKRCFIPAGIFFLILFSLTVQLKAQDFSQIVYNESRGLDRNYVNDIVRDRNGLLWLATDRGVVRFDGVNFLSVALEEGEEPNIIRLRLVGDLLYLIAYDKGVFRLDLNDLSSALLTSEPAVDAAQLPDASIVIFFNDGRLIRFAEGKPVVESRIAPQAHPYLGGALHFAMDRLFVQSDSSGLMVMDPGSLNLIRKLPVPCCSWLSEFQQIGDSLRVSMTTGNFMIGKDLSVHKYPLIPDIDLATHTSLRQWSSSLSFYLNKEKEVVRVFEKGLSRYPIQGKWISGLRTLFVYDSVNLLVGANGGLVHLKIASPAFRSTDQDEAASAPEFRTRRKIIPLGANRFALLGNPGFILWDGSVMKRVPMSAPVSTYDGILFQNAIYATSEKKVLTRYDISSGQVQNLSAKGIRDSDKLYCIAADTATSTLVIGGVGSLYRFDPTLGEATRVNSIGTSSARVIVEIPGRRGWCVGTSDGLYILDPQLQLVAHMRETEGQLLGATVSDLRFVGKDSLWLAHERGAELIDLTSRKVLFRIPEETFPDPRVTAILQDNQGRLWFSTFKGILGYDPETQAFIKVTSTRGILLNREFNFKSALKLPDGRLMFGGLSGYDFVEPAAFPFNRSVADGIIAGYERIGEDGTVTSKAQEINPSFISFDTDHESLRIMVTTGRPLEATDNTYEFRLNGGKWTSFYGNAPFEIYKLRPGNYTLEFRAFDPFGVMITYPAVRLRADVAFYKSITFILSVSLLTVVMAGFIVLILWRGRKRERMIKENISMDLHDELGTLLTKTLLLFRMGGPQDRQVQAEQYLQEGLHSLRVFINSMKSASVPLERLAVEIREMVLTSFPSEEMTTEVKSSGPTSGMIDSGLYRDIKLCVYELINNILKHARADRVSIFIDHHQAGIRVRISDNGLLTDITSIEEKGSGVDNLRKRTRRYHGETKFYITDGAHGLTVDLFFPLQAA